MSVQKYLKPDGRHVQEQINPARNRHPPQADVAGPSWLSIPLKDYVPTNQWSSSAVGRERRPPTFGLDYRSLNGNRIAKVARSSSGSPTKQRSHT